MSLVASAPMATECVDHESIATSALSLRLQPAAVRRRPGAGHTAGRGDLNGPTGRTQPSTAVRLVPIRTGPCRTVTESNMPASR